jgi:hypothetical protein
MGSLLNDSGDLLPPNSMYAACRVFGTHVSCDGPGEWNFTRALSSAPPQPFRRLVLEFAKPVLARTDRENRGWKLPETTLAFPWIARMFPAAKFVYLTRDPRDSVLQWHLTDNLSDFGIPTVPSQNLLIRRLESWKYQVDVVASLPRLPNFIHVSLSDLVLDHDATMRRLEEFLGTPLARVPVRPEVIGRWMSDSELLNVLQRPRVAWVSSYLAAGYR